jgi:hypothetical protein
MIENASNGGKTNNSGGKNDKPKKGDKQSADSIAR